MTVTALQEVFVNHADGSKRVEMENYMKNHFSFLGIPKPKRTVLQKSFLAFHGKTSEINWNLVFELWNLEAREFQYVAIEYLIGMKKKLTSQDLSNIQQLIVQKPWWDSADLIASHLVGFLLLKDPFLKTEILAWNRTNHLWLRRTTILTQLKCKQNTDVIFLEKVITENLSSNEFFINKAIGWALREYAKTDEVFVKSLLNRLDLAPLSIREASKHFK